MKIDWGLTLNEDLIDEWTAFLSNLKQLKLIELSIFYFKEFFFDDINGIEMHDFSDASLKANKCDIYLKFIFKDGNIVLLFYAQKRKFNLWRKTS